MTVLLHSVLTASCYNQHFLISTLPPVNPKAALPKSIFKQHFTLFKQQISESADRHFTPPPSSIDDL